MKYLVLKLKRDADPLSQEVPIIFPSQFPHCLIADPLKKALLAHYPSGGVSVEVVSAGEVRLQDARCSGGSASLGLLSRPQDGCLILSSDLFHGLCEDGETP